MTKPVNDKQKSDDLEERFQRTIKAWAGSAHSDTEHLPEDQQWSFGVPNEALEDEDDE